MITGIITAIGGMLAKFLTENAIGGLVSIADSYLKKEITREEMEARIAEHLAGMAQAAIAELSKSGSEMYAEAQQTIRASFQSQSWFVRNAWGFVVWSQTLVLLWYQIGVPVLVFFLARDFPRTGDDLLKWAYALVGGALFGLGVQNAGLITGLIGKLRR